MELRIDEQEQNHIYSCLLVGNAEFGKVKKSLAKLNREDDQIDEEITLNAKLRRIFNPRAEDEALERARSKDPAQMDLTEAGSSGETGGGIPAGQTFKLTTPAEMTDAELRDALLAIGFTVSLDDIEALSDDDFNAVSEWTGQVVAAHTGAGTVPDEPEALARVAMSSERVAELLAAGPYTVVDASEEIGRPSFDVQIPETESEEALIDDTYDDKIDAELRAARLNLNALRTADMTDEEVTAWAEKGPWAAKGDQWEGVPAWWIEAGTQREVCEDELEAMGRAARYNRSIAQQATEALDISVASDDAEEIVAAGRAD